MKDKNGAVFDYLIWIIMAFVILVFFVVWTYGHGLVTNVLLSLNKTIGGTVNTSIADIAMSTVGKVNSALPMLQWIAVALIFGMILTILISNFLVKVHPVFFVIYLFFAMTSVILAVPLSNYYEQYLYTNSLLGATFQSYGTMSWIMFNLPTFAIVVGIFGTILLMVQILKERQAGGVL